MLRTIASTTCNRLLRTLHGVRNMSSAAPPLTTLSDDEQAMKDAVARFAQETVLPLVGTTAMVRLALDLTLPIVSYACILR